MAAAQAQINVMKPEINQLKANEVTLVSALAQWHTALEAFKGTHFILSITISGGTISKN